MSTGSVRHPTRRAAVRGFTFIELMLSIVIFTALGLIIERTLSVSHKSERYLYAVNRTTRSGQKLAYDVFDVVSSSRKLFQNNADGVAYLEALNTTSHPFAPGARLPVIDPRGILEPDADDDPMTGNVLFFVRESDPAPCVANIDIGKVRYIDTYRFICVYPHETARHVISGAPFGLDLLIWRSIEYPSHPQIMAVEDPDERASVARDLYQRLGYEVAWDPNAGIDTSFFAIDGLGTVSNEPYQPFTIEEDIEVSERGRLSYLNLQLARTDLESYPRQAGLSMDDAADWLPNGFEVKVVGPSGARKVWLNLVVESQSEAGLTAVHRSTLIASTRDL